MSKVVEWHHLEVFKFLTMIDLIRQTILDSILLCIGFINKSKKNLFFKEYQKLTNRDIFVERSIFLQILYLKILIYNFFKLKKSQKIMSSALQQSNREKPMKEFQCIECGKKYSSQNALNTHKKNKHQEKLKSQQSKEKFVESKGDRGRPKGSTKTNHKNKSFEQYQQELEDKIYAYLGELGEKHFDEERELSGEQDSQKRLTGQANYLQNNVVRTPFENQFQISQEIPRNFIQESPHKPLFQALIKDMNSVHAKLSEQRDKWDFKDPLEADDEQDQQFSLIEINNVIKNGKKKGLEMLYPEFSVFLLWIGKICKPTAWKQFFLVLGYLQSQYCEFLRTKGIQRNQVSWKTFTNEFQQKLKEELPAQISKHIEIIQKEDLLNFLKLYYKWVLYFDVL